MESLNIFTSNTLLRWLLHFKSMTSCTPIYWYSEVQLFFFMWIMLVTWQGVSSSLYRRSYVENVQSYLALGLPWVNAFEETVISQKLYHISVRFSVNDIMRTNPLISTSCVTFCHVSFASDVGPLIELTKTLLVLYCFPICGTYKLKETKKKRAEQAPG